MRYVALLRGVNVGGHRKVPMANLRTFAAELGLDRPATLLQSGNLVFGTRRRSTGEIEQWLEREAEKRLGLRTDFLVRSAQEWEAVVDANPFTTAARRDPSHLVVMFLKGAFARQAIEGIRAANPGPEIIHPEKRELYISFPQGMGTSKLPALMTKARLGTTATGRNWNTVVKLLAALRE
jgi:uncharacterized protein (DUF1697 family)